LITPKQRWRFYKAAPLVFIVVAIWIPDWRSALFPAFFVFVFAVCIFENRDEKGRPMKIGIPVKPDGTLEVFDKFKPISIYPWKSKPAMPKAILVDIEGTTTSLSFVHETLFPYARARLPAFVTKHGGDLTQLIAWMDADAKVTELKDIQGKIWAEGYAAGELKGQVYPDAAGALRRWHDAGISLAVFSSGSVAAQKLIFGHSDQGDLSPLFSGWFDTTTGPKRESESYRKIATALGEAPQDVLFLSDIVQETDAAKAAGMRALLINRDGGPGDIADFDGIRL
jgi:enolase-phosphatase E1